MSDTLYTPPAGVLFVEDFDEAPARADEHPEIIAPVYTAQDVEDARDEGRAAGADDARADQQAIQAALRDAALAAIADALAATRADASRIAEQRAEEIAGAMLALLGAALPATAARLAPQEVSALLAALLPPLAQAPEVRVRVHSAVLDGVRAQLADYAAISLHADDALAPSDVAVTWQDGQARRDWSEIWAQLSAALASFALPGPAAQETGG